MQTHAVDRRTATRRPLYVDVLLALAVGACSAQEVAEQNPAAGEAELAKK